MSRKNWNQKKIRFITGWLGKNLIQVIRQLGKLSVSIQVMGNQEANSNNNRLTNNSKIDQLGSVKKIKLRFPGYQSLPPIPRHTFLKGFLIAAVKTVQCFL